MSCFDRGITVNDIQLNTKRSLRHLTMEKGLYLKKSFIFTHWGQFTLLPLLIMYHPVRRSRFPKTEGLKNKINLNTFINHLELKSLGRSDFSY